MRFITSTIAEQKHRSSALWRLPHLTAPQHLTDEPASVCPSKRDYAVLGLGRDAARLAGLAGCFEITRQRWFHADQVGQLWPWDKGPTSDAYRCEFAAGGELIRGGAPDAQQLGGLGHGVDESKITPHGRPPCSTRAGPQPWATGQAARWTGARGCSSPTEGATGVLNAT